MNEQSPLEVLVQGDRVIVRTNQDKVSEDHKVSTDLEVTVPRGASIEGRGRSGDFDVTDISGGVQIASDNAGVRLNKIGGNAKVDVKRSDIVRVVDIKGMVEVLGRGGDLELENIDGPVTVNGSFAGNLEFKNFGKPFHFESRNTDMRVERLPGRISMDLAALTGSQPGGADYDYVQIEGRQAGGVHAIGATGSGAGRHRAAAAQCAAGEDRRPHPECGKHQSVASGAGQIRVGGVDR